ncbi:Acylphosphatase [Photobacterium damselae subsp. piscicida]|uniref:Acylphosphatase n=1 Tax=Photobacterium damsela subsp. piscicida TaxID=38294 RepID=A0A1V1VCL3_PHODP|nr:acylphosphatase [Photobacterium damselae]MBE8129120.1 acylphosphatase [Photobacterium damselae subsp. piscicida]MDP2514090.1 acylphosphatase [Photobacterium damselae subsp. piscicida]MDP2532652.1 acylphosphatase [Photobacterium damselae subsp. piscicida]MDP2544533.1 acylphosphatase [Photobacterium damselae subsp. piscicida]MDP2558699.1 acylphosphatase [Photobacterium damselae subsp. piscicida]
MSQICMKVNVKGVVQGVGFRFHTAHEGLKLGLTGYAKNLSDGSVEVIACGHEENVLKLIKWLETGPRSGRGDYLNADEVEWRRMDGFQIL